MKQPLIDVQTTISLVFLLRKALRDFRPFPPGGPPHWGEALKEADAWLALRQAEGLTIPVDVN